MLRLTQQQVEQMKADVASRFPQEACGLVGGREGQAFEIFPVTNVLHSPARFRMDPQEQWQVFQKIDDHGWDLLAIYHSHPAGPAGLSATDIAEAFYPEVIHLVWFQIAGEWQFRGYFLHSGDVSEIRIELALPPAG
jgi:proteasome lid subunit RPN8/RPN11